MLFECHNCGAPLDVSQRARVVACAYCRSQQVVQAHELRPTPSGFSHPAQWTPPPHMPAGAHPLAFTPFSQPTPSASAIALAVVVFIGFAVLVVVVGRGTSRSAATAPPATKPWDGTTTLACSTATTLRDLDLAVRAKPGIVVGAGCALTLERVRLRGDDLVVMRGAGKLTLDASHLSGNRLVVSEGAESVEVKGSTLEGSDLLVLHGVTTASFSTSTLRVTGARGVVAQGQGNVKLSRTKLVVSSPGPETVAFTLQGKRAVQVDHAEMAIEGGARGRVTLFSSTEEASLALWQPTIDVAAAAQPSAIVLVDQRSSGRASLQHGTVRAGGRPLGINGTVFVGDMQLGGSQLVRGR